MRNQKSTGKRRTPKKLNMQIGERCRQAREASGYTQERLAEQIDVSAQFLSDAERGVTGMSIATIIKLCHVLAVSADYILLGKDNKNGMVEGSLSLHARMQHLSPQKQKLLEE